MTDHPHDAYLYDGCPTCAALRARVRAEVLSTLPMYHTCVERWPQSPEAEKALAAAIFRNTIEVSNGRAHVTLMDIPAILAALRNELFGEGSGT